MFRNQYDNDITTWSPAGRIHQIEYAIEAVKQGSAAVGLKSKTHVVLLALKRSDSSELSSYQRKIFNIDEHMGIAIAGLTSDARVLSKYMRTECLRSRFVYGRPLPVQRIASAVADKAQVNTQRYGGRPFGVGLLIGGYDETGAHLYEVSPAGTFYDYVAMSIGARCQSAKTYLEKHFESFENCTLEELVKHGLLALRDTLQADVELNQLNTSIAIVGENQKLVIISEADMPRYLSLIEGSKRGTASAAKQEEEASQAEMEVAGSAGAAGPASSASDTGAPSEEPVAKSDMEL